MKTTLKMTALICALGLAAGTAIAKQGSDGNCFRMLEGLELTESQQTQIDALRDTHRTEMESLREQRQTDRQAHHDQMKALMTAEPIDIEAIKALRAEGAEHRKAMEEKRLEHRLEVLQLLTPEQREEFLANENRMYKREKMGKRGGKGKFY